MKLFIKKKNLWMDGLYDKFSIYVFSFISMNYYKRTAPFV